MILGKIRRGQGINLGGFAGYEEVHIFLLHAENGRPPLAVRDNAPPVPPFTGILTEQFEFLGVACETFQLLIYVYRQIKGFLYCLEANDKVRAESIRVG